MTNHEGASHPLHTPGPWFSSTFDGRLYVTSTDLTDATVVAELPEWKRCATPIRVPRETQEANAQLIAAAPELLANLKGCLGYFEYLKNQPEAKKWVPDEFWFAPLKKAIAKAERRAQNAI